MLPPSSDPTPIKGVIFDFDGTMVDSEAHVFAWWRILCEEFGCAFDEPLFGRAIGGSSADFNFWDYLEAQVTTPIDRAALRAREEAYFNALIASAEQLPLLPGVLDYLDEAVRLGLRVAIASNSGEGWVNGILGHRNAAHYFAALSCAAEGVRKKPHPDLYLRALDALALEPHEAVAIEDSPTGVRAAKAAGLRCIVVPHAITAAMPLDHADLRLASLTEMPLAEALRRLCIESSTW